ncbi:triphosphoribosyl-dephospho-CoA synthase [Pengzhenrongella sp.]|jgi:triphosphoribosyl-dephospho-CoA synthase|uniref:triphosphoribosyl-dephospho-CoA synthase n=1 Tax=Pengzhenrongella sp. TaxID=2888820 RepID=UPI002F943295
MRVLSEVARPTAVLSPTVLGDLAVEALVAEATLSPKPGLVDLRGAGAHDDMDVETLIRSAEALRGTFAELAAAGRDRDADQELREELAVIGRAGERRMLAATGGVNTHRGAIWALGLVVAAAAHSPSGTPQILARAAAIARHEDRFAPRPTTPGSRVRNRYRISGAVGEAQAAFPHASLALTVLHARRAAGAGESAARLDALLAVMASLEDTCLLNRGGPAGLDAARQGATAVLLAGGVETADGSRALDELDTRLTADGLSPGGSADLLALALFLDSVESGSAHSPLHHLQKES